MARRKKKKTFYLNRIKEKLSELKEKILQYFLHLKESTKSLINKRINLIITSLEILALYGIIQVFFGVNLRVLWLSAGIYFVWGELFDQFKSILWIWRNKP